MHASVITANPLKLDVRSHKKCLTICFFITMSTFQYGLDYSLVGGFLAMPGFLEVYGYYDTDLQRWNIDPTVQQLISSLMTIGTFMSSLMVGPMSAKLGRKHGLWAAAILNAVSTAIMLGTTSKGALYFARLLLGVSVGWFLTFSQLYIHEAAPAHLRGVVFGFYQTMLSVGSVVGASVDRGTHLIDGRRAYQIPLAIFFVAPTIQSIIMIFVPESPRWLMVKGREEAAEKALRTLRNHEIEEHQLMAELNEIKGSTREQIEQNKKWLFIEMWRGTNLRRTLLSIAVVCFHCANGSSWINIYTTYFLTVAGIKNAFGFSIMITSMGIIGVVSSIFFVRFVDRRTVLFFGCLACGICQLVPAIVWTVKPASDIAGRIIVAFIALFTFSYTAYAPYAWLAGGEYPNNQLRPFTFGFATAANFLGNWLGTFTAPYFINPAALGWSAKYGYIWFGSNMILAAFVLLFVPETRDRTLEEIHEMFEKKLKASEFRGHVCTDVERFQAEGRKRVFADEKKGEIENIEVKNNLA